MASHYYLLKRHLPATLRPCQLRCGRVLFPHGTKIKSDEKAKCHLRYSDRAELGQKIAEQLYLSDFFPHLNEELCQSDDWHQKPLSSFATIGITDIFDLDDHCATMLCIHSKDAAVQQLCGGINQAAQKMICPKTHKSKWRIYGNCILVSHDSMLLNDAEIWHEYLPVSSTSLDSLMFKCGFLRLAREASSRQRGSRGDGSSLRSQFLPALAGQHSARVAEQPASTQPDALVVEQSESGASECRSSLQIECRASTATDPIEVTHIEMQQETMYVMTFTRDPQEFEQCLHTGYELEPLRLFAAAKGQSCHLQSGGSIFVHPEQNLQVSAFIRLSGLHLGPSNLSSRSLTSSSCSQLWAGCAPHWSHRLLRLQQVQSFSSEAWQGMS